MTTTSTATSIEPALLGLTAAMRTWTPVTVVSFHLARLEHNPLKETPFSFLASPLTTTVAGAIAATELIADKLPILPDRISPAAWIARTVSGAVTGAAWAGASDKKMSTGAIVGGAAAAVATFALFHARRVAARQLPDPLLGVIEDIAALGIGFALLARRVRR